MSDNNTPYQSRGGRRDQKDTGTAVDNESVSNNASLRAAIGILVTDGSEDAALRSVLRAQRRDCLPLIACTPLVDPHAVRLFEYLNVLGVPGFVSLSLGIGLGYWVFYEYFKTGIFTPGPTIVSVILILVGTFAGFTSIVLHYLNTKKVSSILVS